MPEREDGLLEVKTIGVEKAKEILARGVERATILGVSGFLVIVSRTGMQECSEAIGLGARPMFVDMALLKIKTVLAARRSNTLTRARMGERGQTQADFGDVYGSLLDGGVAIFADEACTEFVGAVGFSGGTAEQDNEIPMQAIWFSGLYTDIKPKPDFMISV